MEFKKAIQAVEKTLSGYSGATRSAMSYSGHDLDQVYNAVGGKITSRLEILKSEPGYPGGSSVRNTFVFPEFKVEVIAPKEPTSTYEAQCIYVKINGKKYFSGFKVVLGFKKDNKPVSMDYGLLFGENEKLEKYFFVSGNLSLTPVQ